MVAYVIRRLLQAILIVVIVSILVFILIRLLPGDPIEMLALNSQAYDIDALIAHIRAEMGLDKPLIVQYTTWFGGAIRGNLGISLLYRYDIAAEIGNRLPITLFIGLTAFIISIALGLLLGIVCAIKRGTWIDNLLTVVANIGITAPQFWVGIALIFLLGLTLQVLPIYGYVEFASDPVKSIRSIIMPVIVLSLHPIASSMRQTRASVLEVLKEDYVRTAWSKGLRQKTIIMRHVLKNALMPVVTLQGMNLRNIVGGSAVVETIFVIPGMGKLLVDAILARDYTVVQGVMLVLSITVVIANLIVDLIYGWLDPRIQYE